MIAISLLKFLNDEADCFESMKLEPKEKKQRYVIIIGRNKMSKIDFTAGDALLSAISLIPGGDILWGGTGKRKIGKDARRHLSLSANYGYIFRYFRYASETTFLLRAIKSASGLPLSMPLASRARSMT